MPTKSKKEAPVARARVPEGKAQMLTILDEQVIKDVKIAAIEDGRKMSHVVEEAIREWLAKRKTRKSLR